MKILFFFEKPVNSIISGMIPKTLLEKGIDVRVISPQLNDGVMNNFPTENIIYYDKSNFKESYSLIEKSIGDFSPDIVHMFWGPKQFVYPTIFKLRNLFRQAPIFVLDIRSPAITMKKRSVIKKWLGILRQTSFNVIFTHQIDSAYTQLYKIYKPVFVSPPGYDDNVFKRNNTLNKTNNHPKIIYIGSITKTRDTDKLLEIISLTIKKTNSKFHIDFFGFGDYSLRINEKIKELEIQDYVSYKGAIDQKELSFIMDEYDAGLSYIPYKFYQNAPALKTIEYMAKGLYVLGSDTKGNKDYIKDVNNGLLANNNPEIYSDMLVTYITNFKQYSQCIKDEDLKKLTWEYIIQKKIIPKYIELIS